MDHDRIIQAAYYAAIAVGLDPTVRNVTRATAAIRGITGVARPVWSESVRRWLSARPDSRTDSKPESKNDTKTIRERHESDTQPVLELIENDTPTEDLRHLRGGVVKVLESERVTITSGDSSESPLVAGSPPKPKRSKPVVEPGPLFGDHEPLVLDFIAVIAAENKTGTITESRIATTRKAIAAEIDRFGIDAVAYGLSECVTREKPALGYAVACARKYGERLAIRPPTQLRIVPSPTIPKLDHLGRPEGSLDEDFPDVRMDLLVREKAFA